MWYCVYWSNLFVCLCVCMFVCKDLLTSLCLSIAQSFPPITRNVGRYCVLAHQTINKVTCKTFQYHKEPSQDKRCSGRFYSKQQLGICASILLVPFSKIMCNRTCRYLWHWNWCSLLYHGHNRLLCRRYKVWLHRLWTEWHQFINGHERRILYGCCISRNMLLLRHGAEIWPQPTEQSQHILQYS